MSKNFDGALSAQHKRFLEKSMSAEVYAAYAAKFEKRASHEKWTRSFNQPLPENINPGELQQIELEVNQCFSDLSVKTYIRLILEKGNFAERVQYIEIKEHDSMSAAFAYLSSLSNRYAKGSAL